MPDFATLQQIDQGQPAGAIAAAAAASAPTMAASYPMVAPHAAPDGSGSMTNLSDGDYLKFKAGIAPPAAPVAPATGLAKFQAADSASDAALKSGGKPASPPQGANGKPALTDVISNIGAAGNEALAAAAGAPVDLATGALNLVSRGTSALTGGAVNLGKISNPAGGSDWWKSALGILGADPRNVVAPDVGTQLLRSGVGGAVSAVLPLGAAGKLEEAASPVVSALGKALGSAPAVPTAIAGATGGVTGQVAQDVVPEGPLKPLAVTAAQLVGGAAAAAPMALAGGAARAGVSAAERAASGLGAGKAAPILDESGAPIAGTEGQPVTATPALANRVAQSIAARAGMSPGELADSIPAGAAASIVPGSVPTVGQVTGNLGVLQAERGLVTASPGARQLFADRRVAQNTAQTEALKGMAPADAQAHAAGSYFVNRLNQIDTTEQQAVAAARAHYGTTEGAVGGQGTTAEIGKSLAAPIRARYGAAAAEADRAIAAQQAKVGAAADEAGGNATGAVGATARQQYGKTLQDEIASIKAAANAERRALYDARDPDGTLAQGTGPIRQAARELHAELRPAAGDKFGPYESEWIDAARNLPAVAQRADLMALRQNVNGALSEAVNGQRAGVIGAANAVRRLTILKNAMDEAEVEATQRAAGAEGSDVAAGAAKPGQTVVGRLAGLAADDQPSVGSAVYTPSGSKIDVRYRVVDAPRLVTSHDPDMRVNPAYPAEMQPRNRTRAASEAQVARIAGNLSPERLGPSASAVEGAPVVGSDGIVESGNARVLGIQRAYEAKGPQAAAYRKYLEDQGYDTAGMKQPVLVRERVTPLDQAGRARFAEEANGTPTLAMSASERARTDAGRLSDETLAQYRPGDVSSAANADFVRSFMRNVVQPGEEGALQTAAGGLSAEGERRIENALLQKAYGDPDLVAALSEVGDENIRAFGNALTDSAGAMAKLRSGIETGDVPAELDISKDVLAAANAVRQARVKGIPLREMVAQQDAFAQLSPRAKDILENAYGSDLSGRISRGRMADFLAFYADEASKQSAQPRLFGEPLTGEAILGDAAQRFGYGTTGNVRGLAGEGAGARAGGPQTLGPRVGAEGAGAPGAGQADVGKPPLTENLTAEDVARARAADAFNGEYMQRFGPKTLAGKASAKQFGDFVEPASTVPGLFWRKGPLGAESTQQLIATMGSREAAEKAIGDYAAFDLKAAASGPDGLSAGKLSRWLSDHNDALNSFPALRDRFGTLAKAQAQLDALEGRRTALEEANPIKRGQTGADSISQFVKAGPKGGEAIDQYLKQAGATPEATAAATDALAHTLRLEAMKGGDLTAQAFDRWRGRYSGALERLPDAAKQFDGLGNAQKAVEGAEARAMQTRTDFLKGVGRFYLTKGGDAISPTDAISSVLGSPTAPASAASLMREAAGDANAVKGIRLNLADWISGKVTNTAEAGTSGDLELSNAKLQKLTANPDVMRAIETIDPKQAETLRAVAADAQRGNRSVTATKIPGSPASAADAVAAREPPEHEIAGVLGAETIAHAISHVAGLGPLLSIVAKGGAIAGRVYDSAARAAGIQTERDLMTQALLNPDLARALLSAAKAPKITASMGERLHGTLAALTTSAATMPVQEKR